MSRARALRGAVALLLATLAGAACRRAPVAETNAAPKRPPLRACDLLLLDEADPGGADGLMPFKTEVDQTVGDEFAKCVYATSELPPRMVGLEVRRFAAEKNAVGAQRTAVDYLPSLAAEALQRVPGLGDEAVWAGGKLGQLHVRDGSQRLIVTVETRDLGARRARAESIARLALGRLHAAPAKTAKQPAAAPPSP